MPPVVRFQRLPHAGSLPLPAYATPEASGIVLSAAIDHSVRIFVGYRKQLECGFNVVIPPGYEGHIRSRNSLARLHGVTVLNSPATIPSNFRGELFVILQNNGAGVFTVEPGMPIAMLAIVPVIRADILEMETL